MASLVDANIIPVEEMQKGDIGVVVEWGGGQEYVGTVVQRVGDYLTIPFKLSADLNSTDGWSTVRFDDEPREDFLVKLIPVGSEITIRL